MIEHLPIGTKVEFWCTGMEGLDGKLGTVNGHLDYHQHFVLLDDPTTELGGWQIISGFCLRKIENEQA